MDLLNDDPTLWWSGIVELYVVFERNNNRTQVVRKSYCPGCINNFKTWKRTKNQTRNKKCLNLAIQANL